MNGLKDSLCIVDTFHIVQAGDEDVQLALAAFTELEDFFFVIWVAYYAGHVPAAVEEERGQMEGDFAVAAE